MVNFFATVPVCVNSSRYGGGREGKGGGGGVCACVITHVSGVLEKDCL